MSNTSQDTQQAQKADDILTYRELQKRDYAACPTRNCPEYVALWSPGEKELCECSTCNDKD